MIKIKNIVISTTAPEARDVGWLFPLSDGTFELRFLGPNGWSKVTSEVSNSQENVKTITAITLTTNTEGTITGGTATLSDDSTIPITITQV